MTNIDNLIFPYPTEPTPVFDPDAAIEPLPVFISFTSVKI